LAPSGASRTVGPVTAGNAAVGANAGVVSEHAGFAGVNTGNAAATQQSAIGANASNQSSTAQVDGPNFAPILQHNDHRSVTINFGALF
jgi:hypothetical protein